jgi:dTMP kinase
MGKKRKVFTPTTFSLIQAADFTDRWENQFLPMLKAGVIVLADRYAFTGFARDVVRGVNRKWVRNLYSFALQPRSKLKYYEAGMDLNLSEKRIASFRLFQGKILKEYEKMVSEFDFKVLDATRPVHKQQKEVRRLVNNVLKGWRGLPNPVVSARNYTRDQARRNSSSQTEVKNGTR